MKRSLTTFKKNSPLKGKHILITRPADQARDFIEVLKAQGAEPISFPTIRIIPPRGWSKVDKAIENLSTYDTLIFTSVNGVKFFFQRLNEKGKNMRFFKKLEVVAIGPKTASAIERFHLRVDIIPKKFQAESVIEALEKEGIASKRFLLPRAEKARDVLPKEITKRGGNIDVVTVYRTGKGEGNIQQVKELFRKKLIHVITFTSSSTVKNFVKLLAEKNISKIIKGAVVASIGPITADTAASLGIRTDIMPKNYTIPGLVKAILAYFSCSPQPMREH
ncbi:MAG TPA: uroporphyrinogen-III synthase [Thermodesulfobacteriota bacterium]|nr:uroporphyrinogen-III synthase [Thermodesulfobacteriota bacterium]